MEIVPPTSITIPLLGKYILFTMIMVTASVLISVLTLNVRYRSAGTHTISKFTRVLFFQVLPRFLFIDAPGTEVMIPGEEVTYLDFNEEIESDMARLENPYLTSRNRLNPDESKLDHIYDSSNITSTFIGARPEHVKKLDLSGFCNFCAMRKHDRTRRYPAQVTKAFDGMTYVAKHLKEEDESTKV